MEPALNQQRTATAALITLICIIMDAYLIALLEQLQLILYARNAKIHAKLALENLVDASPARMVSISTIINATQTALN